MNPSRDRTREGSSGVSRPRTGTAPDAGAAKRIARTALLGLALAVAGLLSTGFSRETALLLAVAAVVLGLVSYPKTGNDAALEVKTASMIAVVLGLFVAVPLAATLLILLIGG